MEQTDERCWEAELYRLKGELTLAGIRDWELELGEEKSPKSEVRSPKSHNTDPPLSTSDSQGEAEVYFQQALEISRRQHAKSLELRAAMSLARLWQSQDKSADARTLLEDIYGWFTEGFNTKDLQEVEALLVTLGGDVKTKREQRLESGIRSPGATGQSLVSRAPRQVSITQEQPVPFPTPGPRPQTWICLPRRLALNPRPLTPSAMKASTGPLLLPKKPAAFVTL